MTSPRTLHDIRTMRSSLPRATSGSEPETLRRLSQLASEKDRLKRELSLWQRKTERILLRVREIEQQIQQQMEWLERESSAMRSDRPGSQRARAWNEIELRY